MSITPEPEPGSKPDVLRELYQQAVADDRGPSAQNSDAILARAKQRAAAASQDRAKPQRQPAANDRFWLRHALGGLAAIGLVGWLMLQHAAWWDGSDKGIGVEPDASPSVAAEQAAPAPALSAESNLAEADSGPSVAVEGASAAHSATRQSSVAQASKGNPATALEGKAPAAMDMEAKAPEQEQALPGAANATPPMAAPAPSMERSARMAPAGKASASSAGDATPHGAEKSLETADIASQQNPEIQAKLPLCPLVDEEKNRKAGAHGDTPKHEKSAAGTAVKPPDCRPRKASEKRSAKPGKAFEATESVANPVQ